MSRLLLVENTHNRGGGAIWPMDQLRRVTAEARRNNLRAHLDGARLWNACAATGIKPAEYAKHFDTVACCFSKGLGAPVGSAVCGDRATIARVHRFRKMFGGAMRQAGVLAAAALYALDHHVGRLAEDHANARRLADAIAGVTGLTVPMPVETNMVFFDVDPRLGSAAAFCDRLASAERPVRMMPTAPQRVRAVCHLDVDAAGIEAAIAAIMAAAGDTVAA